MNDVQEEQEEDEKFVDAGVGPCKVQ